MIPATRYLHSSHAPFLISPFKIFFPKTCECYVSDVQVTYGILRSRYRSCHSESWAGLPARTAVTSNFFEYYRIAGQLFSSWFAQSASRLARPGWSDCYRSTGIKVSKIKRFWIPPAQYPVTFRQIMVTLLIRNRFLTCTCINRDVLSCDLFVCVSKQLVSASIIN